VASDPNTTEPVCEKGDWWEVRDVRHDRQGWMPRFDEVLTGPVDSIHIEQMSDQTYWMAIYKGDERLIIVFSSQNLKTHVAGRFELEQA
jgi:hypothetical protein